MADSPLTAAQAEAMRAALANEAERQRAAEIAAYQVLLEFVQGEEFTHFAESLATAAKSYVPLESDARLLANVFNSIQGSMTNLKRFVVQRVPN